MRSAEWPSKMISRQEGLEVVGHHLHRVDWIPKLTAEENWLVSQYGSNKSQLSAGRSSILPGRVTWVRPPRSQAAQGTELASKIASAIDRHQRMLHQRKTATIWLNRIWSGRGQMERSIFETKAKELLPTIDDGDTKVQFAIPRSKQLRGAGLRADMAINALWPKGPPDRAVLEDQLLIREVIDWLKKNNPQANPPSRETILRRTKRIP
jgi:hypothetical protein